MEEAEVAYAFESGDSYFQPGSSRICFVFVKWERTDAPPSDVGGVGGREGGMPLHRIFFVICIPQQQNFNCIWPWTRIVHLCHVTRGARLVVSWRLTKKWDG